MAQPRKSVTDQFREDAQDARNTVHSIMLDGLADPKVRLKAAEITLDRAMGKAAQGVIMIPLARAIAKQLGEYDDETLLRIGSEQEIPGEAEYKRMADEPPVDGELIINPEDDPLLR
jgi:hypothetical protein